MRKLKQFFSLNGARQTSKSQDGTTYCKLGKDFSYKRSDGFMKSRREPFLDLSFMVTPAASCHRTASVFRTDVDLN